MSLILVFLVASVVLAMWMSKRSSPAQRKGYLIAGVVVFLLGLLWAFGISPRGILFDLGYLACSSLFLILLVWRIAKDMVVPAPNLLTGVFAVFVLLITWIAGDEIVPDREFSVIAEGRRHSIREHSHPGFVGSVKTRYEYDVYADLGGLLLERKIGSISLFDIETRVDFESREFSVELVDLPFAPQLCLRSSRGDHCQALK